VNTPDSLDFSPRSVPESWVEAAADAPSYGDPRRRRNQSTRHTLPVSTSLDLFTACLAAGAASIVSGYAWYELHLGGFTTPWITVAIGLIIATAIRLGGGSEDIQTRGILGLLIYLLTTTIVISLITRATYVDLYGTNPGLEGFEQELFNGRLTDPLAIAAWVLGGALAAVTARVLR
jgi:hypothetical protein